MSKSEIAQGVGFFLFFALMINGCVHSCKKHKDDPTWLQDTPAVIYRGIEYFWHDDFEGVNWDSRLKNDVEEIYYYLAVSTPGISDSLNMEIEKLSTKISKYPSSKIGYLKTATHTFINYVTGMRKDVQIFVIKTKNYDSTNNTLWSAETISLYDSIRNYYNFLFVENLKKDIDSMIIISPRRTEITDEEIGKMNKETDLIILSLRNGYFKVFNEKI